MKYLLASMVLLCLAAGCSGGGSNVAGKVTLDDGTPVPRGSVQLSGTGGSFRGGIGSDGTYRIAGVPSGNYNVAITGAMDSAPSTGENMNYDANGNYVESAAPEPKSLIKESYGDPEKSGLKLTVPGSYDLKVDRATDGSS